MRWWKESRGKSPRRYIPIKLSFSAPAPGAATEESDIDLVVVYSGSKSNREVEKTIQRLFMPRDFAMDVFVMRPEEIESYKGVANTLSREVSETGVVCYGQ